MHEMHEKLRELCLCSLVKVSHNDVHTDLLPKQYITHHFFFFGSTRATCHAIKKRERETEHRYSQAKALRFTVMSKLRLYNIIHTANSTHYTQSEFHCSVSNIPHQEKQISAYLKCYFCESLLKNAFNISISAYYFRKCLSLCMRKVMARSITNPVWSRHRIFSRQTGATYSNTSMSTVHTPWWCLIATVNN